TVRIDEGHPNALGVDQEGALRHDEWWGRPVHVEPDGGIAPGEQQAVGVRYLHLGQQRPGRRVDRTGGAGHRALEDAARLLPHAHVRGLPRLDVGRVRLRHVDEDAQDVDLREAEELARSGGRARGDERAGVDVAGCDDAVERRVYLLEALQIEHAVHVRRTDINGVVRG